MNNITNPVFPRHLRGIIFDLDGTLYHMRWFMKGLLMAYLFPHSMLLPEYMKIRQEFAGKDLHSGDALLNVLAEQLGGRRGKTTLSAMRAWIEGSFYNSFERTMALLRGSRPGINETLVQLKEKGYLLGVLSDFGHVRERLDRLKIAADCFDALVSSEETGALKPCPRPFRQIAATWRLAPEHILVIGDKIDTDGEGARKAGMLYQRITDRKNDLPDAMRWSAFKTIFNNLPAIHS